MTEKEKTKRIGPLRIAVAVLLALVVLVLIGGMLMPSAHHPHERVYRTACASNLKQIGYALRLYSSDHDEKFPENLPELFHEEYLTDHKVFICPMVARRITSVFGCSCKEVPQGYESYCYASGVQPSDPPEYVVAFDEESNHDGDGVNVLFTGGNVRWIGDLAELHERLAKQLDEMRAAGRTMTIIRPAWSDAPEDGLSRR